MKRLSSFFPLPWQIRMKIVKGQKKKNRKKLSNNLKKENWMINKLIEEEILEGK